jgi:biopolymer transport protein ExbB
MNANLDQLWSHPLVQEAIGIWLAGGWAMIALVVNAMILFGVGFNLWIKFKFRAKSVSEKKWRRWIAEPDQRKGNVGRLLDFVMDADSLKDMTVRFAELEATELSPFDRDLKFMKRAVSTAPLLGLLGTVTGMLTTFSALADGSGGDKTMDMIAGGISEALITTETGLIIALPGLFFQFHLKRLRDHYEAFLAHLESACTQYFYRKSRKAGSAKAA